MKNTRKIVLAGLFLALGIVLPFVTGQIPKLGASLLPMHIPVLICGFMLGGIWGTAVGFVTPLLRSILFGMPPMFPTALCMAFELAVYGLVTGVLYKKMPKKAVYIITALLTAMIAGRIVWGIASFACYGFDSAAFGWQMFAAGAFINAVPGIALQIVLVPVIVYSLAKAGLIINE